MTLIEPKVGFPSGLPFLCLLDEQLCVYFSVHKQKSNMSEEKDQLTLKQLRERAGLTQRQLADRLNITIKTISAWERGVTEPHLTISETQRLMDVLQCTFEELLEATSQSPQK